MKTTVIIVRHGESTSNVSKIISGHHDNAVLTELGEQQASKVGAMLKGLHLDAIYASPLKRAAKTCEIIVETMGADGQALPEIQTAELIKEINLPLWESKSFVEAETNYPEEFAAWRQDANGFKMAIPQADGTTADFYPVRDIWERATAFLQGLLQKHQGQTILLAGHSAINRALIGSSIGLGPASLNSMGQGNCAINVLNFLGDWEEGAQLESLNLTAHLGNPLPKRRSRFKGPRLLLVRHGETNWNRDGRFQGQIDIPLNENGHKQAAQAGEFLKVIKIDAAVSSSMLRPKETAEGILQHHPDVTLETTEDLWEISHGEWEGKLESEIEAGYPGLLAEWQSKPEAVQMPGGENLDDVWRRAKKGWNSIVAAYSEGSQDYGDGGDPPTVMVVAHDAINKAILCQVLGLGPEKFWQFKQGNGAVSVIDYLGGPDTLPVLSAANITTHLSGSIFDKTAAGAL